MPILHLTHMLMTKSLLPFFVFFTLTITGCSNYHLTAYNVAANAKVNSQSINMVLPPNSRFDVKRTGLVDSDCQFQAVLVDHLDKSYTHCLKQIAQATYVSGPKVPAHPKDLSPTVFDNGAATVYLGRDTLQVTLDYQKLFSVADPVLEFHQLGAFLIKAVAGKLPNPNPNQIPATITQELIKKIFELVPFPVDATATRYGYSNNHTNFMLMFDEDLQLDMDAVSHVDEVDNSAAHYELGGIYPFRYQRDRNGEIAQNPLATDHTVNAPNNVFNGNKVFMISAFADLQNSSELRVDPFMVIFSPTIKRNNDNTKPAPYATADDAVVTTGNFSLFNLKQPGIVNFNFSERRNDQFDQYTRSVFGARSQGKVVFNIYVNHVPLKVGLGDRVRDLAQLPEDIKVHRLQNGAFHRVCGELSELMLLPGDQITFGL